jgi:uncharacterized protein
MDGPTDSRRIAEHGSAALDELMRVVPALTGAVLSRSDGFEVVSRTRSNVAVSRLSALASSLVALGQASMRELGMNGGGSVLVEGADGKMLLLEVPVYGHPMVLAAVGGADVVTGTLLWAARDCVRQILNLNPESKKQ